MSLSKLLLALVFAAGLVASTGCGGEADADTNPSTENQADTPADAPADAPADTPAN